MSRDKPRKPKKGGTPIMLPQALAGKGGQESSQPAHQAKHIQELVDLLKRNNITELELEQDGVRIRVRQEVGGKAITAAVTDAAAAQGVTTTAAQPAIAPSQPTGDQGGLVTITSPIVGTFYRSPSPDADPYVEEGDMVKKGQVLCIVEAMKLMNEIESEVDGKVVKILAESTKPVEYGQALFHIDPKASA